MIKFLLRLIVFLSPIVGILLLIEVNLGQMPNSYTQKKSFLEEQLGNSEILVMGSSHSLQGINPHYFSRAGFNLANTSQDLYYDSALAGKYQPEMPNLKLVIIPISYFSLEYKLADSTESWRRYFYYRIENLPLEQDVFFDLRSYSYIALYGRETAENWLLKRANVETKLESTGWLPVLPPKDQPATINSAQGKIREASHESIMNIDYLPENINILRKTIETLHSKNIKLVFITTPVFHTYADNINPLTYRRMQDTIQQLETAYKVPYFNYMFDPRFTIDDFADNDHLDIQGAQLFSQILDRDIIQPMFAAH